MKILVTGGAGYIGSFMAKALLDKGYDVIVFDSLERGHRDVVDKRAKFVQGDLKSPEMLDALFSGKNIDSVMHFAAYTSVEESTKYPEKYYENNTKGSENLVKAMIRVGKVDKFIFSSTSAIYGNPIKIPIPEDHPKNPINPYGKSKLKVEEMLVDFQQKERLNFVSLRYFNAAGAALDASMGENHSPELHIIPLAIKSALAKKDFYLYGTDYNTPDRTCIRDYIHVIDLVDAHILALEKLLKEKGGFFYNVGTGKGNSNKDVLSMVKKQSGIDFKVKIAKRRSGDPEVLVSDPSKIMKELGFKPKYSDLETIVGTALKWHRKNSK
ncbi:MAG: UDP-glucose 4-epimerase GalE [Candidatus Levybacteria bacterium RIFCSPHIGHO2_02_FULL_37_13]|nr:MAG: UDP-glucose 4-epimerase GalE [Candidatus Levybacteria bacterium RIFCSPHIGHO2_02_FULL_37_13]OGH30239.1 MAG: UDP-glucose 4-epimerase GalE [Candidatus Levybacteria bacterium RIFCSPHIGHO2_12_FULL_37_9]OGH39451.1 MAG: UDP-glucose 4-epimerase GalE [Candidatus Levybacteria bacterium RIFCSPLOWO2_01_FULL_37_26]